MSSLIALEDAPELRKIDESKALQIKATFEPMVKLVEAVEGERQKVLESAKEGVTNQVMADARNLRLEVAKVRISAEKKRVAMKQEYLRAGQAVDGANNVLKWAIVGIEKEMTAIEKHFENAEKERLAALQIERVGLISPYLEDAGERDLASMEPDVWNAYFNTKKKDHEDRVAAEKKAEEDRLAEEEADRVERERVKAENERLRKEAKERDDKEAEEQAERDRVQKVKDDAHAAELEAERVEKKRIADELAAKEEAEAKEKADAEETRQAELNKGDSEKVADLIVDLEAIKAKYSFDSDSNKNMFTSVCNTLDTALERIIQ
jgi:hypothetical protein